MWFFLFSDLALDYQLLCLRSKVYLFVAINGESVDSDLLCRNPHSHDFWTINCSLHFGLSLWHTNPLRFDSTREEYPYCSYRRWNHGKCFGLLIEYWDFFKFSIQNIHFPVENPPTVLMGPSMVTYKFFKQLMYILQPCMVFPPTFHSNSMTS